ncbi:hypothetical protein BV898_18128 [Hypsibius exemplaris]|uniref:Uncharacterized protein n=1 Tax=Hypsibius exemplaris TaxID=2072580 RepID=A0A9X6RNI8_HYPEX|nr:hypothetical protein BV898_18128 [Hypsibius exemplaris]
MLQQRMVPLQGCWRKTICSFGPSSRESSPPWVHSATSPSSPSPGSSRRQIRSPSPHITLQLCQSFDVPGQRADGTDPNQPEQAGYSLPPNICEYVQLVNSVVIAWSGKKVTLTGILFTWAISLDAMLPPAFGIEGNMLAVPSGGCAFRPSSTPLGKLTFFLVIVPYFGVGGVGLPT